MDSFFYIVISNLPSSKNFSSFLSIIKKYYILSILDELPIK